MFEAFRVGPIEAGEGKLTLYMACSTAGMVSAIAPDDRAGLAELRKRAPAEAATCEPGLAVVGAQLGFRAAELSDTAKLARAAFATVLHLGKGAEPRVVEQISQTIEVAQRFLRAQPWRLVRPEVPIEITISMGGREQRRVASVLGADGIERGLALHENAAALARFVELAEQDRPEAMRAMPFSSLTIDAEPDWVADAVKAAFGDPIVIVPITTSASGPRVVTSEELTMLAAAMFAISKLASGRLTVDVSIDVQGGGQCHATAQVADPGVVGRPLLPAWATQPPMSWNEPIPRALLTVPVLPVSDLAAAMAGLRVLGFTVTEAAEQPIVTVSWPGFMIQLVHAPAIPGGTCQIVVEDLETLVAVWKHLGVDVHESEQDGESLAYVEVPGGLSLSFGTRLPDGYQPAAPAKRRAPRRRAS